MPEPALQRVLARHTFSHGSGTPPHQQAQGQGIAKGNAQVRA
eukprot:gene7469-5141_t